MSGGLAGDCLVDGGKKDSWEAGIRRIVPFAECLTDRVSLEVGPEDVGDTSAVDEESASRTFSDTGEEGEVKFAADFWEWDVLSSGI